MLLVFLDESGNHNLDITKLDNIYNIFVLGAVCFTEENYALFDQAFRALKKKHFGSENYVLHTVEMTRPSKSRDPCTCFFNKPDFRESFYKDMNHLIEEARFSIVACAIKKEELIQKYINPEDPYHFALENIVNRTMRKAKGESIRLFPENRDNAEDRKLEIKILEMKVAGTRFYRGADIVRRIDEFRFVRKGENQSGSQLADLIVTPIGRHLIGKQPRPGHEISYEIIKSKITQPDDFTLFP